VILGLGHATLMAPRSGGPCLIVARGVPGVRIAGVVLDALAQPVRPREARRAAPVRPSVGRAPLASRAAGGAAVVLKSGLVSHAADVAVTVSEVASYTTTTTTTVTTTTFAPSATRPDMAPAAAAFVPRPRSSDQLVAGVVAVAVEDVVSVERLEEVVTHTATTVAWGHGPQHLLPHGPPFTRPQLPQSSSSSPPPPPPPPLRVTASVSTTFGSRTPCLLEWGPPTLLSGDALFAPKRGTPGVVEAPDGLGGVGGGESEDGGADPGDPLNPGVLSDVVVRVGAWWGGRRCCGASAQSSSAPSSVPSMVHLHSGSVVGDHIWIWRDDDDEDDCDDCGDGGGEGDSGGSDTKSRGGNLTSPDSCAWGAGLAVGGDSVRLFGLTVDRAPGCQVTAQSSHQRWE